MSQPLLVTGNRNYSSWSLRAWLALRKSGADFGERRLPLDTPEFQREIAGLSPSRRVPALWDGELCIWDSLAIAEYANERWAKGGLWPAAAAARARARSFSAEMHAGFAELRNRMPMNIRALQRRVPIDPALQADIDRVLAIWDECLGSEPAGGPWLFGAFSIADAMFAPVALRFRSYGVEATGPGRNFVAAVLEDADVAEWMAAAVTETEIVEADEAGA